jgi:hypothetical protein
MANTEADLAGYNIYRRPVESGTWTKLNQSIITENSYFDTIPYYEAYCYYVSAVDETENESGQSNIVTYLPPDYKSDIGNSEPSVYLIERDSFIKWEDNSARTADIDNTELVYCFSDLNSDAEYEIGFVYYRGDTNERTQTVTVDDIELQEVNIPSTPEMYVFPLPQSVYDDEIINIHIDKITGPNVILSEIYLWEIVPSGGQSGGKTGLNRFGLTLKPNIFKNSTKISYQLPVQSHVLLRIYNSTGRSVKTLINELASKGINRHEWNGKDEHGRDIPAGVYIVWLSVDNNITTKRLLVVR